MLSRAALALLLTFNSSVNESTSVVSQPEPLNPVKLSPKKFPPNNQPYEFQWLVEGRVKPPSANQPETLRFRIYSQERKVHESLAQPIARTLLELWTLSTSRLKLDHKPEFGQGVVDLYLCWGGIAGGEQLFDQDLQVRNGLTTKVNTIYIYDLPSFTNTIEQLREVAHEYGHAVLPAFGGYREPEYWANGYLGEKLFLTWLHDGLKQGRIDGQATLGVSAAELGKWVRAEAEPLMVTAALRQPIAADFVPKGQTSMDNALGLFLWMNQILPYPLLARLMRLAPASSVDQLPSTVVSALEGCEPFSLNIPESLRNKPIWLPFGRGKVVGAKLISSKNGWVKVIAPSVNLKYLPN